MKTFSKNKEKIKQYKEEIEQLQSVLAKENGELKMSIYSLWGETKFLLGRKKTAREYFYLSMIDPVSSDFFQGIWINASGTPTIGKIPFICLYDFDEYEAIEPKRFFGKLKTLGIKLNEFSEPVAIECCKYKPTIVEHVDDTYRAVGYCRLSRNTKVKNFYDRQISLIEDFARYEIGASISEFFAETVQGTTSLGQRKAISDLIEFCKINDVYTIIVSEMNRLGRTENVIMSGISFLMKNGIKEIYCIKEKILVNEEFISEHYRELKGFAKTCETEYEDILHRMKTGYDSYIKKAIKSNGKIQVGRPSTYRKSKEKYFSQYSKEVGFLLKGELSLRQIHTITGTSLGTLQKIKKMVLPLEQTILSEGAPE